MKKTIFALALLVGLGFSALTYANFQDQPSTTKTESVKQDDQKKTGATCTEKNKNDSTSCTKEQHKNCQKSCCKKESK